MYEIEKQLVESFISAVYTDSPFSPISHTVEFDYRCGRSDILIKDSKNKIIAVEAKLSKWREALHQAYRCSSFANYSYVLLPCEKIAAAKKYQEEFIRRNVGLCTIIGGEIQIIIKAPHLWPIQKWLSESALELLLPEGLNENARLAGCC